jgi:hypothetical protein
MLFSRPVGGVMMEVFFYRKQFDTRPRVNREVVVMLFLLCETGEGFKTVEV